MTEAVIVAAISLIGTLFGTLGGIVASSKMTLYRIEQLEKKQDKHNTLIERMYKAEDKLNVLDERQKVANHRIDDLEHRIAGE